MRQGAPRADLFLLTTDNKLSQRQLRSLVGSTPVTSAPSAKKFTEEHDYDAVIVAKAPKDIISALELAPYINSKNRPCYVAFQPGLEFTPERGFANRKNFDAIFMANKLHAKIYKEKRQHSHQYISFGHPYFLFPNKNKEASRPGKDIIFFAQAISPSTEMSRLHILRVLNAIARRNPSRQVVIKLRHLPSENANHAHRERYPYPILAQKHPIDLAPNLEFVVGTMEDALRRAAFCVTCTSTAAMDSISAGIPTAVYLDYVQNYLDDHAAAMQSEFSSSRLITSLPDLLNLQFRAPDTDWMGDRFRSHDLFDEVESVISSFKQRSRSKNPEYVANELSACD